MKADKWKVDFSEFYAVTEDNRVFPVAGPLINSSVTVARQGVNRVIDQTLTELRDPQRRRSPSDLLTLFRLPSANALSVTRAAETYEEALDIILSEVRRGGKYGVTHRGENLVS